MGDYSRDEIHNIKSQITLSAIIGASVDLRPAGGRDTIGLCPFHSENTPSFHVNDQRYICFGCKAKGDIFSWLSLQKGISFPAAVRLAGELIGTTPAPAPTRRYEAPKEDPEARYRIVHICDIASLFFQQALWAERVPYICERFSDEAIRRFDIGYAPIGRTALPDALHNTAKYPYEDMLEAQLCAKDIDTGELYSRYRDRITIPLKDKDGYTLGFLGRIVPSEATAKLPKYLCPRNSAAFNKRNYIFGQDQIKKPHVEYVLVVEGTIDAITLWDRGVRNVVSTLGCDVSDEQARQLSKLADKVVMLYDGDQAGYNGMANAASVLPRAQAILLPQGQDPDTFARDCTGPVTDALKLLPRVPIQTLAGSKIYFRGSMKYDTSILEAVSKPYVDDNIKNGWPQFNVADWVMQAYPQYARQIKAAVKRMTENAELMPDGRKRLRLEDVQAFIKEWKKPCLEVRKRNADQQ